MIQALILYSVIFILGLLVYMIKPKMLFIYWMFIQPVLVPIVLYIFPIGIFEVFFEVYDQTYRAIALLFLVVLINEYRKGYKFHGSTLIILALFLVFYLFLIQYPTVNLNNITMLFCYIAPLMLLTMNISLCPNKDVFLKAIILLIILQGFFCLLNTMGFSVYPVTKLIGDSKYLQGTFPRYNHMTNVLTTIFAVLAFEYFGSTKKKSTIFILTCIVGVIVFCSGAKMSVAQYFLILLACVLLYAKKYFVQTLVSVIIFILIAPTVFQSLSSLNSEGLNRIVDGFTEISTNKTKDDVSTVALSTYLLTRKFDNPIFGNGYEGKNEMAYSYSNCTLSVFKSDARIAFVIVDYGLMGFLLYFLFFKKAYKFSVNGLPVLQKRKILFLFLCLILQTITDKGLFDPTIFPYLFLYPYTLKYDSSYIKKI